MYKIPDHLRMEQTAQAASFSHKSQLFVWPTIFRRKSPALDSTYKTGSSVSLLYSHKVEPWAGLKGRTSRPGRSTQSDTANGLLQEKSLGLKLTMNTFLPENKTHRYKSTDGNQCVTSPSGWILQYTKEHGTLRPAPGLNREGPDTLAVHTGFCQRRWSSSSSSSSFLNSKY